MIEGYKDPTPRMLEVLRALSKTDGKPLTGNQIGVACGFHTGHREKMDAIIAREELDKAKLKSAVEEIMNGGTAKTAKPKKPSGKKGRK